MVIQLLALGMAKSKIFIFILFFCLFHHISQAQERIPAFQMNDRLARGINMGNTFEAPSEDAWGNPWKAEYFEIIADLGFDHIRLPVRWEPTERSMASPPYTINATFLNRIKEVVDVALNNKLHIIVNMHHHEALFEDPAGQKDRFLSQWSQIAQFFKDYPDSLLFEVLNEPHGNLTPALWNEFFSDALDEIRKSNPTRTVLMGVAEYGGLGGIVHLDLPDDEYIILSPHYYNPFNFTHQGAEWVDNSEQWLGTEWHDTEIDRETVENEFKYALQFSQEQHIPIHVGEFGAYSKADIESRERWTTFLARWFEENNMSWAYWEFSAGFGIYNPDTKELLDPLVNALLHNEKPDPIPVYTTALYTSDFSSGTDGWSLNIQGGAAGSLSTSDGKLNVSLTSGGTESWHAQLVKNNIPIKMGSMYRISFKVQAGSGRSISTNVGKASDPWNSYSGYHGFGIGTAEENYSYSFTMNEGTDLNARLVFDLGKSNVDISITEIKIELISFEPSPVTGIFQNNDSKKLSYFPNPVSKTVHIPEMHKYQAVAIYDLHGRSISGFLLNKSTSTIDMKDLRPGIYIIKLSGDGLHDCLKVLKN